MGSEPGGRDSSGDIARPAWSEPVNESEFWSHLEFRLCREFAGLPDRGERELWCDGLIPEDYCLQGERPHIKGRAWVGGARSRSQALWEFILRLPRPAASIEDVDWATLLPAEEVTEWLAFDEAGRWIEIEPARRRVKSRSPSRRIAVIQEKGT